jgi:diamine N-acetyltransferase
MIAHDKQGKGYGRKALDLLCEYVRGRPNADYLYSSYVPGKDGPENFYLNYGFEKTGEMIEYEVEIRFKL